MSISLLVYDNILEKNTFNNILEENTSNDVVEKNTTNPDVLYLLRISRLSKYSLLQLDKDRKPIGLINEIHFYWANGGVPLRL